MSEGDRVYMSLGQVSGGTGLGGLCPRTVILKICLSSPVTTSI